MITCPITSLPLEKLYKYTFRTIKDKLDNGKTFDVEAFMSDLFEESVKNSDKATAAKWMQSVPRIINIIISNSFSDKIPSVKGLENIYKMMADFSKPGKDGINNVLAKFTKEVSNDLSSTAAWTLELEFSTTEEEDPEEEPENDSKATNRLKTPVVMSGTLPAFTPVDPKNKTTDYVERLDKPRAKIMNNLEALGVALEMSDPFAPLKYQGKTIKVKATNLYGFSQQNFNSLDPTTQKELKDAAGLSARGRIQDNVTQPDKRVILVISDQAGNILYFDDNGNITTREKGKPVYQFMRDVRKTPKGYIVTDIYGAEEQLMSAETYAQQTYDKDIDGDFATYLEQVKDDRQKELKKLYETRERALKEDILLDFAGISSGVNSELTATKIPLSEFLNVPGANRKSLKTIKTLKKAEGRFPKGRSTIDLNGTRFMVNRSTMPDAIADQIAAVMFDPSLSFETKLDFYSQFIPEDKETKMAYTMRKHEIIPNKTKESFTINIYDEVGSGNGFLTEPIYRIPISQKVLAKSTPEQITKGIEVFSNALKKGQKNNKPTFISYKSELLNSEEYLTYNPSTKQFQVGNYINFITSLDGQIDIIDADPGFYNKHLLFNAPSELSKRAEEVDNNKSFEDWIREARDDADQKKTPVEREKDRILEYALSDIYKNILKEQGINGSTENYFITSYLINQINTRVGDYNREFAEELLSNISFYIGRKQVELVKEAINESYPLGNTVEEKKIEIIQKTVEPEMPDPTNEVPKTKRSLLDKAPKKGTLDRSGYLEDEIGAEDTAKVLDWWNNTKFGKELQKHIKLEHAYNLVNSDVFAKFVVDGSTLANPDIIGKILINPDKGSLVDIYHEAWHAFSQLYLTRQEKYDLYDEVINYTDANGNQPYALFDYKAIDEFLAEDFRTYMKKNYIKKGSPVRNKLFRKIMNFLRSLFGLAPINPTEIHTDIMNIPKVRELFENLNYSSNKKSFVRRYQANINNVDFFELDRGIAKLRKPSDSALSKQDSDLISNSMDMIISDIIDDYYEERLANAQETGKFDSLKSGTIGLLLDPDYRAFTYGEIEQRLKDKLAEFKSKLHAQPGIVPFSDISKLESDNTEEPTIESEAVAVLTDTSGERKYVFLQSQIDGFDNLEPNLKKGTRVRGENWHGIKIVGDFYTHKSIKDAAGPVEIIVVSNIEDAQIQFDNYKAGGAKKYIGEGASVEIKDIPEYSLTPEQELILDNIRILTAATDNFGDPEWELKNEAPKGTIAYHLENSDFEISKTKYYLDKDNLDENGEEIDEDEENQTRDTETPFGGDRLGKKSVLQLASKEVVYVLKSLHKVNRKGEASYNRLGFKERADFKDIWGIITKSIGGIRDRKVVYEKLKAESKNFPELKQLIETKLSDPTKIGNMFEQQLSNSFWQTFAKPSIKYYQFTVFPQYGETMNLYGDVTTELVGFESDVTESSLAVDGTIRKFEALFKSSNPGRYISKNDVNQAILNLTNVVNDFENKKSPGELDLSKSMEFAATLGIKLDNLPAIKEALDNDTEYYGLQYFYDIVKDFKKIQDNPQSTDVQKEYLTKFINNPISILRTEVPKGILETFKKEVAEKNILKRIAELQIKYGYANANPGVLLPDGNIAYENVNHSQVSVTIDALNTVENLADLWTDPKYSYMSHFKPGKSFFTLRSKLLAAVFDTTGETEDFEKKSNRSIQFLTPAGTQISGIDGFNTADLDKTGKFFQNLHTFGLKGIAEFIRHAEKKSAFGIKQLGGKAKVVVNGITNGVDQNLYIDMSKFVTKPGQKLTDGEIVAVGGYFLDYIAAEFDRIRYFKQNPNDLLTIKGYNREVVKSKSGKIVRAGELFTAFDNILRKDTKADLYKLANDPVIDLPTFIRNNQELFLKIQKDIVDYFDEKVESLYKNEFSKLSFIDPKLYEKLGIDPNKIKVQQEKAIDYALLKAYLYNDWIHKFETFNLINGDLSQFNHDKQAASKRAPGSSSDGDGFLNDEYMHKFINNVFNKNTYAAKLAKELNDPTVDQFVMEGKLNTGVIADAERTSVYLQDMLDAWEEKYRKDLSKVISDPKKLKKEVERRLAKDAKAYKKMTESDGGAFITLDAYRTLRFMNNKWSVAQESLYQQIINGEDVDSSKIKEFFPIYKLHYYGSIANAPIATTGMHKFAVTPIIPTVAKPGTALYDLHLKMLKSNMQYYAFGSGSKVSTLTMDGNFDNIFAPDSQEKAVSKDAPVRLNQIHLEYLKDVTEVSSKLKKEISYPTQKRVLLLDGMFDVGEIINSDHKEIVDDYINAVGNYTDISELELLNKIGYEYDPKTETYTGQLDKFIELIREELGAKEIPDHLITLLDTRVTGNLSMDFSIHPQADTIEKIIVNRIQKSVIKQKTKGEALVQAPSTFYNGIWDNGFNVLKDEEEIKKLLGTNNLPFYRTSFDKDGNRLPTEAMKVALALNGDFLNILKLKHPDGEPIGNRDRLNALIQNEDWLKENRDLITITGPRIPTDAPNSMEFAEVWHFLDASVGNTVIVPTEIVAKAGSDFDVDKIFFMLPNINSDGTLPQKPAESIEELRTLVKKANKATLKERKAKGFRSAGSLINEYKKWSQNQLINSTKAILSLPDNYAALTKPNNTYLVEDQVEFYEDYIKGYNFKQNAHQEPVRLNIDGDEVMSPSRVFDDEYNLAVHEQMLSGNLPLGILAKKNKVHTLFKSVGAVMPATYKATIWNDETKKYDELDAEYKVVTPIKHQSIKGANLEDIVSLSHENNVDGEKIGDIFSHGLQGILDRANNPFPHKLKIVKEAITTINHLIEAGASIPEVFAFINNPIIEVYIDNQIYLGGSTSKLLTDSVPKHQVKSAAARLTINQMVKDGLSEDVVKQLANYANDRRLMDVTDMLQKQDLNKKYIFTLFEGDEVSKPMLATGKRMFKSKDFPLDKIVEIREYVENVPFEQQKEYYKRSSGIANNDNYYYAGQAAWTRAFGSEDALLTEEKLKDIIRQGAQPTIENLAILLRMIQLEKQFSGMDALEMAFNPDTGLLDTTLHVKKRDNALTMLSEVSKVDKNFLNRLRNNSILSSFYKSDLILDLTVPLFSLRLNDTILNYIDNRITKNKEAIAQKYGAGIKGQERFTNAYNNAVVNYIYQNTMSNYPDENGQPVLLPNQIHTYSVNQVTEGPAVALTDKGFNVNLKKAENDYNAKIFYEGNNTADSFKNTNQDTFLPSENPFPTFASYLKFIVEKEYLKSVYKEETDSFITQRALMNSFNRAFIMGTTKYSYTDLVMNTISEFEDQNIKFNYPILAQLAPAKFEKEVNVLELNDRGSLSAADATEYYKNLIQLADPTVRKVRSSDKVKEKADNKKITDVFKNFSLMMFYQHGVGYSKLGFNKVLDPQNFTAILETASASFLSNNLSTATLDQIFTILNTKSNYKNYVVNPKDYTSPEKGLQNAFDEFTDNDWENLKDFIEKPGTSTQPIDKDIQFEYIDNTSTHDYYNIKYKEEIIGKLDLNNYGYIDGIEIDKKYRNKGLGKSIYRKVNLELLNGELKSDSLGRISENAKRLWESLVKSGEAIKINDGYKFRNQPQNQPTGLSTYTNHSGGAAGSDTQWDIIGKEFGMVNNKHYYTGVKGPGNAPLGNEDITDLPIAIEGASKVAQAAKQMWGYKYTTMKDQRLIRNWAQVANSDAVFAIGTLGKEGDIWKGDEKSNEPRKLLKFAVQGGTGYAVEMAIQAGKPVYVFDQVRNQWYKNLNGEWSKSEVPVLTKNFAGIGTREINEAGKQAIRDVYEKTFNQAAQPTASTEIQPGLELFKGALSKEEQKEFYEFGKSILEKHGYNPFPQYVMASAGKFEWSPELVADKTGKAYNRGSNYNRNIVSQKAVVKGSDGTGRWGYHYYPTNLDGSPIVPIPQNIKAILEKITGQDMGDYDTVLINLYPSGRTLGWHTDVTEDHRNLDRDIISVSIGANADFTFANTPNDWISGNPADKYELEKINLNSGDVISFGGPSRLISHTVTNVNGKTDLGPINLENSNVNKGFKGGLNLTDDWRLNFTFRVADPNSNNGKRSTTQEGATVESLPTEAITDFYNGLTEEQKNILGNLDELIEAYNDIPFNQPVEDYIEMLKCKL